MADTRLTPEEMKLLIESGDLTHDDLAQMYREGDKRGWATGMKLMEQAGKGPEMMGNMPAPPGIRSIVDFAAYSLGIPFSGRGGVPRKASASSSQPAQPSAPPKAPSRPAQAPPRGSNLERHGNVTRPGPDAHKGGGGPSRPSGPVDNPLDRADTMKGPAGNPDNYRTLPGKARPGQATKAPDRRKVDLGPPGDERRKMYEEMKAGIPDPPAVRQARARANATRQSPSSDFDEADKRAAAFGGVNQAKDGYVPLKDRAKKPLSKKEIEQMIQNILNLRD